MGSIEARQACPYLEVSEIGEVTERAVDLMRVHLKVVSRRTGQDVQFYNTTFSGSYGFNKRVHFYLPTSRRHFNKTVEIESCENFDEEEQFIIRGQGNVSSYKGNAQLAVDIGKVTSTSRNREMYSLLSQAYDMTSAWTEEDVRSLSPVRLSSISLNIFDIL